MNFRSILKRSLAFLLVLATVFSLLPSVFATGAEETFDPVEDMLLATLQEDGELTYEPAPEAVKAAVRATYPDHASTTFANRMTPRVAIFIDPDKTEPTTYTAFDLRDVVDPNNDDGKTYGEINIDNLYSRGVTDFFVMTKPRAGKLSTTHLKNVIKWVSTGAKVYAWMHCARDDYYLTSEDTAAGQYHFRAGTKNSQNGKDTTVTGFVDLANADYVKYFNGLVDKVEACSGVDGILLDSVYFGTIYLGWGTAAQNAMGATNWNVMIPHLVRTANTDGGGSWRYNKNDKGFYVYGTSGSYDTSASKIAAYMNGSPTAAAVKSCFDYRTGVINTFIKNVKSSLQSGLYLAVCTTPNWQDTMYTKAELGIDPAGFGGDVNFAVAETFIGQTSLYADANGNDLPVRSSDTSYQKADNTWPTDVAKKIAKLGCNVMVGVDSNWSTRNTASYAPRAHHQSMGWQAYHIHRSRFDINGDPAYGGDILGAALWTAGDMAVAQANISDMSSKTPYVEFIFKNGAEYSLKTHLIRFDKHTDNDIIPDLSKTNSKYIADNNGYSYTVYNSTTSRKSKAYIVNNDPETQGAADTAGWYVFTTGLSTATHGQYYYITVPLKNFNPGYANMAFAEPRFSRTNASYGWAVQIPTYTIYKALNHTSCSFSNGTVYVAATCTTGGLVQKKCATCGYDYVAETAASGHSYTSVVTPPTCTTDGYTTHTCSCGDTYTDSTVAATGHTKVYTDNGNNHKISCSVCKVDLGVGEHTFSNGVCTLCGHVATKFLHFKAGSAEINWTWLLSDSSAAKASMDGSGNGTMYATFNGNAAPSFYVDAASADKIDHPITAGDVVQLRIRVTGYTGDATNVSPTVSFDTGSGSFGTALTGDTINLAHTDWQIVTIPISGYTGTIEQIKVAPFGNVAKGAKIEIDYIYIGETGRLPVTVTFVNYDGSVLAVYPIDMGSGVTYSGITPTRPNENNFKYTFKGWKDAAGDVVNLSDMTFAANTTLTAYYDAEYADPDHIASSKQLVDNDGNLEDYSYDLVIDAYSYGQHQTLQKDMVSPMDVTIVFDRSTSIAFPAVYRDSEAFPNTDKGLADLKTYLNNLTKNGMDKKQEGYYVASNFLGVYYTGTSSDPMGLGTCSYEAMKYMNGDWYVWQTLPIDDEKEPDGTTFYGTRTLRTSTKYRFKAICDKINVDAGYAANSEMAADHWGLVRPASVLPINDSNITDGTIDDNLTQHQDPGVLGKWVKVVDAYKDFYARIAIAAEGGYCYNHNTDETYDATDFANVYFRVSVSRRGLMQDALTDFVDQIWTTDSKITDGSHHKVSVLSYGYGAYYYGNTAGDVKVNHSLGITTEVESGTNRGAVSSITLSSQAEVDKLKAIINNSYAFGSTYTDDAMKRAQNYVNTFDSSNKGREGVLLLLTDGLPTHSSSFNATVAKTALGYAKTIKGKGVELFAIGFMPDINSDDNYTNKTETADGKNANNFLHLISSNYPNATDMTEEGTGGNSDAGYYLSDVDGTKLAGHLATIFGQIKTETDITTAIDGSMILYDIIKREWDVVGEGTNTLDITVQRCDYLGNGEFDEAETLSTSSYSVGDLTEIPGTGGDRSLTIEWKDAPNAWLRETPLAGETTLGYKILVTIGIKLDRDSTIGGNNIPTNGTGSGAYYPDITNPKLSTIWDVPNVNVEPLYDYKIHDFFMDLYNSNADIDLIRAKNENDAKTNNTIVHGAMYSITQDIDSWNNKYVSIKHSLNKYTKETIIDKDGDEITTYTLGDVIVEETAASGAAAWTKTINGTDFDFSKDSSLLTAGYILTPTSFGVDSLGRYPWMSEETAIEDGIVNYYAPKYAVLDFGTKVEVDLDNEAYLDMGRMSSSIDLSDDAMSLTYNFEDGTNILSEVATPQYIVTAINTPKKGANDKGEVSRTFTILPANNVMYEETYLSNVDNWDEIGTVSVRTQSADCTTEHGYDSNLHNLGLTEDYSFGHAYIVEASSANNNKAMTFSFKGTGFDVLSRTGPEDGVMVVEVYSDAAMTKKVKTALANNYLKDTTLYQVPVVRYLGLTYGTYYVKIRAYYADIFNANYSPSTTGKAIIKDAKILADLGIAEGEIVDYFAASDAVASAKPATRAATATSYDVVVDGIRVYNPLGTISEAANPEAYYIYGLANEINPTFYNARDLLLDSKTWSYDGEGAEDANGLAYIAATSSSMDDDGNVGSDSLVPGIHLSMEGELKTTTVAGDDKVYLLDPTGTNRVQIDGFPTTSYVYVRKVTNEAGRTTYHYFCLDKDGKEVDVTGKIKVIYYNSNYEVNGPKNEIYLNNYGGIAFQVKGEGRVMVGASSSDGNNVFLQVYSEKDKKFVNIYAHTTSEGSELTYTKNRTELYYDITDYVMEDGTVVLRAPNGKIDNVKQNGTLSISGIKVIPADGVSTMGLRAPAKTVQKGVELIQEHALPEIESPVLDGNIYFGEQLALENDLTMTFRLNPELIAAYDISTLYLIAARDVYGSDGSVTVETRILTEYVDDGRRLVFSYTGISAAQMNDEIRVTLHIKDAEGQEYVSPVLTTSVTIYLRDTLASMPTGYDALYTLIMDMLNYGTAAQYYFGRHTDAPANEAFEIFKDYESYASADLRTPLEDLYAVIKNEGAAGKIGQTLELGTRIGITYKVTLPEGVAAENAKLVIKDAEGNELETIDVASGTIDERGRYIVNFFESSSRDMRRVVYATVYVDGAAVTDTYAYSISTYAFETATNEYASSEMLALTKAMVIYGDSAVAYFG